MVLHVMIKVSKCALGESVDEEYTSMSKSDYTCLMFN